MNEYYPKMVADRAKQLALSYLSLANLSSEEILYRISKKLKYDVYLLAFCTQKLLFKHERLLIDVGVKLLVCQGSAVFTGMFGNSTC